MKGTMLLGGITVSRVGARKHKNEPRASQSSRKQISAKSKMKNQGMLKGYVQINCESNRL